MTKVMLHLTESLMSVDLINLAIAVMEEWVCTDKNSLFGLLELTSSEDGDRAAANAFVHLTLSP